MVSAKNINKNAEKPIAPKENAEPVKIAMSAPVGGNGNGKGKAKGKMKKVLDPDADRANDNDVFDIDALVEKINKGDKGKKHKV